MASCMKGPWEVGDYEWPNGTISYNILGPEATRYREGNRLLIEAAPDLLEALKGLGLGVPSETSSCHAGMREQSECANCQRITAALKAIAKAEGKS